MTKTKSNKTTSKTARLVAAFSKGQKLTAAQIQNRFGFETPNSARAAVSHLWTKSGYPIVTEETKAGVVRYGFR